MPHVLDTLKERGFLAQITFEEDLYKLLEREQVTYYVGYDPTADSLHVGNYVLVMAMAHMQRAGHRPIALVGGGTTMVGDPSFRDEMRKMLTVEEIARNAQSIKAQLSRFLDFSEGKAILANNADWLLKLNYVDFLREIGVHFSVNRMLTAECYKQRLEKGLSFLEFNYMLMQSYDFLELHRRYGCKLQLGGDDQWSNILGGADLIRRKEQQDAFVVTCKLLLKNDGEKMGKTAGGAVWLSAERTSPYDFYQYWRNVHDNDVEKCLKLLTFLPLDEIAKLMAPGANINEAKTALAFEVTKQIHGQEAAEGAMQAAQALFGDGRAAGVAADVPTTSITRAQLAEDGRLTTLVALCGLTTSRGEARKTVAAGGVSIGDQKVEDVERTLTADDFPADGLLLRKGKKTYHRVVLAD